MGAILWALGNMGYWWAYRILDAQWSGLAQRRDRVFIVGSLGNWTRAVEILLEPESSPGDSPPSREAGKGTTPILEVGARTSGDGGRDGDGIGNDGDPMYTLQAGKVHGVANTLQGHHMRGQHEMNYVVNARQDPIHSEVAQPLDTYSNSQAIYTAAVAHTLRSEGADASEDGTGRGVPLVAQPLRSNRWGGSDSHGDEGNVVMGPVRSNPRNNSNGATDARSKVYTNMGVRRLTPVEASRLQGFPDDWCALDADGKPISDSAQYRMLGNAVAVNVVEWIARRFVE